VARFLERLAEPGPWTRSRLQRAVGVNYDVFRRYLDLLVAKGHVQGLDKDGKEEFVLTVSGQKLRSDFVEWTRQMFGAVGDGLFP